MPTLRSAVAMDEFTVELTTSQPDSFLPINLTNLFMASPAHWQKKFEETGNAEAAWAAFAADPSGTGPFRVTGFVPRERLELAPNTGYWNPDRTSKLDGVVLVPLPEANARTAALLSGQVDWIEAPAPDAIPQISRAASRSIPTRSRMSGRGSCPLPKARPGWTSGCAMPPTCALTARSCRSCWGLHGYSQGHRRPDHPWWGNPSFDIRYDLPEAQRLMTEAGFSADNPVKVKVQTSASGSGQMQPIPMNEYLQQALRECYFDVELDVIEWNTVFTNWRRGANDESRQWRPCDQRQLRDDGPVLCHGALHLDGHVPAGVQQLGPVRQ
jgi:peptide/nickel transport system substrate-binding protein